MNGQICPKIELVQDLISVLITCKSDEESIKNENAIIRTTFTNSHANGRSPAIIDLGSDRSCSRSVLVRYRLKKPIIKQPLIYVSSSDKVAESTQELIQSVPLQAPNTKEKARQKKKNTVKQPQIEQM